MPRNIRERSEALGVEAAIKYLQRDRSIDILVSGRPGTRPGSSGPDLIAYDRDRDRLMVIEAKGTHSKSRPLQQSTLYAPVGGHGYTQPSRLWLAAEREPPHDYLPRLRTSSRPEDRRAGRLIQEVIDRDRTYDAVIVHVHPALDGTRVYGRGIDRSTELLRDGGGIGELDIVAVPYPNRR